VLETRRGVGSFVSATPAQAHPPRERERRLRTFITRLLADAERAGFGVDEVIAALEAHRQGGHS
jgi:DNA-binding transcriptional regulator YhcF (GntR family)